MEYLLLPIALLLGIFFLYILSRIIRGNVPRQYPYTHHESRKKPKHRFTNKEIMTPGIDIRLPEHQQRMLIIRSRDERIEKTISKAEKIVSK